MNHKISGFHYSMNALLAVVVTAILAIPVAWLITEAAIFSVKAVHYRRVAFAPFELVFVSEQETQERLGGDFVLHPDLFERRGTTYSAVINDNEIQFVTIGNAYLDEPCEATVNSQPIDCEQTIYFSGEFSIYYFIRLVGYLGITADQAQQINARHDRFDSRLETIRMVTFGLVPIGLYFGVDRLGSFLNRRFVPQFQPTKRQESFLQLPWAIGLFLWTLLRVLIEVAFS